jgi:lysozyme
MTTSDRGIELIQKFEGFRDDAYICPAGKPTIGFGTTQYGEGRPVKIGDKVTYDQAVELLKADVVHFENCIRKLVKVPLTQNRFDALVSFTYNLGCGALERSTLLKKLNVNPDDPAIRWEFHKWNKGGGHILEGLTRRRFAEADLYFNT